MYLLKMPHFLEIEPTAFNPKTWSPPITDHHSLTASENFSAYNTALTTIRWRRSPSKPAEFQSNARILRWSDGSLTLQLGSDPLTQYEIQPKALAPPQKNPIKPTPLSKHDVRGRTNIPAAYDMRQDTWTYLAQPFAYPQILRATNKITTGLTVAASGSTTDDALERLQRSMKAARSGTLADNGEFKAEVITEDPVLAQKKAEIAEREKLRAQRKLEAQQMREAVRMNRAMNRAGLSSRNAGLTIGGLEDEGGAGGRRGPGGVGKAKQRRNRHRKDWSEDEDDGEDYEEDDFVAADDDEEEVDAEGESEEDVDAQIEAQWRQERLRREQGRDIARAATPKRPASEDEAGAGGEGSPGATRHKRRRVVEDDDEE
jgi:RNA polymerase-associated protein LEO1